MVLGVLGFTAGYIRDSQDLLLGFDCGSQNSEKTFTWFEKDLTQEQPDGRDAQSKVMGKELGAFPSSLSRTRSPVSRCSPTQELSKPYPFGFLWRLHYQGMMEEITNQCN